MLLSFEPRSHWECITVIYLLSMVRDLPPGFGSQVLEDARSGFSNPPFGKKDQDTEQEPEQQDADRAGKNNGVVRHWIPPRFRPDHRAVF